MEEGQDASHFPGIILITKTIDLYNYYLVFPNLLAYIQKSWKEEQIMDVGARITFFRQQKNYSVNKLANLAGISQSYLRDVELGNKNPTVELLSLVCEALDISLKDFFDDGTMKTLAEEELMRQIYQLSGDQRERLSEFLNTML